MGSEGFGTLSMRAGKLLVYVNKAENIKGSEYFGMGTADPYVSLALGDKDHPKGKGVLRSEVHRNGGANPIWENLLVFVIEHGGLDKSVLHVNLYDKDPIKDRPLGSLKIDIAHVLKENSDKVQFKWYSVFQGLRHKARGKILMAFAFEEMDAQGEALPQTEPKVDMAKMGLFVGIISALLGVGQLITGILIN